VVSPLAKRTRGPPPAVHVSAAHRSRDHIPENRYGRALNLPSNKSPDVFRPIFMDQIARLGIIASHSGSAQRS
jgi:hypothetical protein